MSVISAPHDFNEISLYVDLKPVFEESLYLKVEGLNLAGSVKLKTALALIDDAEATGRLRPGSVVVESSSGNLGVALSMIAASKGYEFVCVIDPRCNPSTRLLMEALGARIDQVTEPHPVNGFLGSRLDRVQELCTSDERYVWLNQYANPANWRAHYATTAAEISTEFPDLDVVFVGAGTTGTLMGCARYFKEHRPSVQVVAVDAVGSVTFGGPQERRLIPGLGMGVPPPQLDPSYLDDVVMVSEPETIRACHVMAHRGFLFGGSTGTVVSGALRWLSEHPSADGERRTAVALSPDLGGRYLDTIYDTDWVLDHYGARVLDAHLQKPLVGSTSAA